MTGAALLLLGLVAQAGVGPSLPSPASAGHQGLGRAQATAPQSTAPVVDNALQVHGQLAWLADALPRKDTAEVRPRASIEITATPSGRWRFRLEGMAEALGGSRNGVTEGIARVDVREAWAEFSTKRAELRAGYGRLVWGRLDEIQPSDVINPIDTARFLLEGRAEARRAVTFVRGRVFATEKLVIEGVIAPRFRRGTFDALAEETSPFNLVKDALLPAGIVLRDRMVASREPDASWRNVSGGARVQATLGRVDVSGMAYRGFDAFGPVVFEAAVPPVLLPAIAGSLVQYHPRFTMVAADAEAVVGEWAVRGEAAWFVDRQLASTTRPGLVAARSLDAGAGLDRRAGAYRVFGSWLVHREWSGADPGIGRTDVTLVVSIERQFARDRFLARAFGVANPADSSGFVRGLLVWTVRDDVSLDVSAASFLGAGDDTISRFAGRDFVFARLRYAF